MPVPGSLFAGLTGRIIVRLASQLVDDIAGWSIAHPHDDLASLPDLAVALHQSELAQAFPPSFPLETRPLVSLPVSEILQLEAAAAIAALPPLHSLTGYWVIDARPLSSSDRIQLAHEVRRLSGVELVHFEHDLEDPWTPGGSNPYRPNQGYLRQAPEGIGAEAAWAGGYDGGGMRFIDLERYWNVNHDDLKSGGNPIAHTIYGATIAPPPSQAAHGTHVLGIVAAQDNDQGVVGIAPQLASVELVSRVNDTDPLNINRWDIVSAIAVAITRAPHVLLIEVMTAVTGYPVEVMEACFDAIRLATALGITVVEAAGNGTKNLDTPGWDMATDLISALTTHTRHQLSKVNPANDSGAIMVAGGESGNVPQHRRWVRSNYGSRIDCYGWADSVYTTGDQGDTGEMLLDPGAGTDSRYISNFGGTSAATAIVAGAALLVHQMFQAILGTRLGPLQARYLLSAYGTPQAPEYIGGNYAWIGVMPNLAQIAAVLAAFPDIYARGSLLDTGLVPNAQVGQSPDILVLAAAEPNPDVTFGNPADDGPPREVQPNQTNYVYVRLQNRGGTAAATADAAVYWSQPSTMLDPGTWHAIGTTGPVNVAPGGLRVAGPIQWYTSSGNRPAGNHGCFVALVGDPLDPRPLPPTSSFADPTAFTSFLAASNNVAWRNFTVVDVLAESTESVPLAAFWINGLADQVFPYELVIGHDFPPEFDLRLVVDSAAAVALGLDRERTARKVEIRVPPHGARSREIRLGGELRYRAEFIVKPERVWRPGEFQLAIAQFWHGKRVGGYSWRVRVGAARRPH